MKDSTAMNTTTKSNGHSRAKAGGEYGANGEWYEGGKFINTVPENEKRVAKKNCRSIGRQQIEMGVWDVSCEGKVALFPQLSGIEYFDRNTGMFTFNEGLRLEYATTEQVAIRKTRISAFNAGQRWV